MKRGDLAGMRATVMGLGLHGGGIETARYLVAHGADVTVTDLHAESDLRASIDRLDGLDIRFVLGTHEDVDFSSADLVVKNPAVPRSSRWLSLARKVETDISLFLDVATNPLLVVTGTKGKSTTVSALHHVLLGRWSGAKLGGNSTVSPLAFLTELRHGDPVVLELSSFQLGDLRLTEGGPKALQPAVSCITNIYPDHQNYYHSMESYVSDKRLIYQSQTADQIALFSIDDPWSSQFPSDCRARVVTVTGRREPGLEAHAHFTDPEGSGATVAVGGHEVRLSLSASRLPGAHQRLNLLNAAVMALQFGLPPETVRDRIVSYRGIEHRLEPFLEVDGVSFVNDSAATIPEAALAAVRSFHSPVVLIAGGTDKELSFEPFRLIGRETRRLFLLAGSGTDQIVPLLQSERIPFFGPFEALDQCVEAAIAEARAGEVVLFSPGCTSFGMFANEFDRGRKFKASVHHVTGTN